MMNNKKEKERKRVCCNCGHNIRVKDDESNHIRCECAIDGHRIGYVECFEHWCRRWCKSKIKPLAEQMKEEEK